MEESKKMHDHGGMSCAECDMHEGERCCHVNAGCRCPFCRHWPQGSGGCVLLRLVLGMLILVFVFVMGVRLGEFKSTIQNDTWGRGSSRFMMRGYDDYGGWGMMRAYPQDTQTAPTPTTPKK